jgi:alcohol dehydrogenase (cytochrome c)
LAGIPDSTNIHAIPLSSYDEVRGSARRCVRRAVACVATAAALAVAAASMARADVADTLDHALPGDAELLRVAPGDWLHFNRTYAGDRFSPLTALTVANAGTLTPRCVLQLGEIGSFETSPLVYQGRMYVTTSHKTFAADASTCAVLWSHSYTPVGPEHIVSNRGVALYRGRVYRGTPDGHLLALDADTGKVLWDVEVADPNAGYFISAAPMAFDGRIYVGEGGGDHGIKGHIHAFDAASGKPVWTFNVIPTGAEAGAETWGGGQETGGGSSWSSMAVDPGHRLLFVPTGNPGPDFNPGSRKGDNLYTDSIVVLSADSGKLAWYVQQVPADYHDWDTAAAPSIYEQDGRRFMAVASKDGFLYLYDRDTHQKITTAKTMTRVNADVPFNATAAVRYCPGGLGQWNGAAYSPKERLLFVGAADRCDTIQMTEPKYVKGQLFFGGALRPGKNESMSGTVRGIDAATGHEAWLYQSPTVIVAGVTPTAGGLLFTGDGGGDFLVFDARSGKVLYRFATGGGIAGGITTYEAGGEQLVAVPSGNSSRFVWNTSGSATVIVFGLAGGGPRRSSHE